MTRLQGGLVLVPFVALFGWDLWEALGNLVGLAPFYEVLGIGDSVPWILLWTGVALPVVALSAALILWRRWAGAAERLAVMFVAWALVAALSLSLAAVEQAWRATALQALSG